MSGKGRFWSFLEDLGEFLGNDVEDNDDVESSSDKTAIQDDVDSNVNRDRAASFDEEDSISVESDRTTDLYSSKRKNSIGSDTTEDLSLSRRKDSIDVLESSKHMYSSGLGRAGFLMSKKKEDNSITRIELEGRALFKELIKDVSSSMAVAIVDGELAQEKFANIIEKRFNKTITAAVTGISSDELIMNDLNKLREIVTLHNSVANEVDIIINSKDLSPIEKWSNVKKNLKSKDESLEGVKESLEFLESAKEKERMNDTRTQDMISEQASALREDYSKALSDAITLATKKLTQELSQEKTPGFLWNYENSLKQAEKERSIFNVVGKVYDAVGSMCHSVAKYFGASKTAAELFQEAADLAQDLRNNLMEVQIERENDNAIEGERSNVRYYDMKKRGLDNSSKEEMQKKVNEHDSKVSDHMLKKLKEQFGEDVAKRVISRIGNVGKSQSEATFIDPERTKAQVSLDNFYKLLNQNCVTNAKEHIEKLREAGVFAAMAKIEEALLVQDVKIEGKVYKGKISGDKIPEAMRKLEKAIKKAGTRDEIGQFELFKTEVKEVAPKETWANRALSAVGASKSRSF